MGVDTLPTSNVSEPYSTPFYDTQSFQDAPYHRKNVDYYQGHSECCLRRTTVEQEPQATVKAKMPLVGSSSTPLKVQALKEKAEASRKVTLVGSSSETFKIQDFEGKVEGTYKTSRPSEASRKPVESTAAKYLKGQSLSKSWNGSGDMSFSALCDTEEVTSQNKGKSVSLAIQEKVDVQKRGQNPSGNRSSVGQREQT